MFTVHRIPQRNDRTDRVFHAYYITPSPTDRDPALRDVTKLQLPIKMSSFYSMDVNYPRQCVSMIYDTDTNELIKNNDIISFIGYIQDNNYSVDYKMSKLLDPITSINAPLNNKFCMVFVRNP